ncbi:hypothetical protein [Streptomyces sp. NEAU-NA10]|uniref:hypothetical protein n=1 Tax=Streptomyces sp. NEAU-NA10 TaxID=3416050 RepID=UPI003CC5DC41
MSGQPQDARTRDVLDGAPDAAAAPPLRSVPSAPGGRSRKPETDSGQRPLLLAVRSPHQVSAEELAALRAAATPDEIRQAITELGGAQALFVYGHRLVAPYLADLPDHHTGT